MRRSNLTRLSLLVMELLIWHGSLNTTHNHTINHVYWGGGDGESLDTTHNHKINHVYLRRGVFKYYA